jgi:hypothetical protein
VTGLVALRSMMNQTIKVINSPFVQLLEGYRAIVLLPVELTPLHNDFKFTKISQILAGTIVTSLILLEFKDIHHGKQVCK